MLRNLLSKWGKRVSLLSCLLTANKNNIIQKKIRQIIPYKIEIIPKTFIAFCHIVSLSFILAFVNKQTTFSLYIHVFKFVYFLQIIKSESKRTTAISAITITNVIIKTLAAIKLKIAPSMVTCQTNTPKWSMELTIVAIIYQHRFRQQATLSSYRINLKTGNLMELHAQARHSLHTSLH